MIFTVLIFIIVLGILVFVHELGHFLMAKKMGMKIEEFAVGFPPRAWSKVGKDGVKYSIGWIPLGGYVNLNEDTQDLDNVPPDHFLSKKPWQRFLVLIAGVTMNFLLCAILLTFGYIFGLPQSVDPDMDRSQIKDYRIQIISVIPDSPADQSEVAMGDMIYKVAGTEITSVDHLLELTASNVDQEVEFEFKRGEEVVSKNITPAVLEDTGKPGIGVGLVETGIVSHPWYKAIYKGFETTILMTIMILGAFYEIIKNLIVGAGPGMEVSGPVGIAVMTGQVAKMGFVYILQFTAVLSLNLAIINFLPFPALDGGRLLFIIIEKIRRKPLNRKVEAIIHTAGFSLLMLLILVVTFGDVLRYSDFASGIWNSLFNR